jgi:kynurenine 3-monooxygenase
MKNETVIVGGGLVGSLAAIWLARQGHATRVLEKRPAPQPGGTSEGRSINLVVTSRGIQALQSLDLWREVRELCVPVAGRVMHDLAGVLTYQPYSAHDDHVNYSVNRGELNDFLRTKAQEAGSIFEFDSILETVHWEHNEISVKTSGEQRRVAFRRLLGADGVGSRVRQAIAAAHGDHQTSEIADLGVAYKELRLPLSALGKPQLDPWGLHIWPRGKHMLMALANRDGSFTLTLYLPKKEQPNFASLASAAAGTAYVQQYFPDLVELMPEAGQQLLNHPAGNLGTVSCRHWVYRDQALLVGDAAHGIVPFFGQGMNSGFEDVSYLMTATQGGQQWDLPAYAAARQPNAAAIARMAIANYHEMSAHVAEPSFLLRKAVERQIEAAIPEYQSRYSLVVFSLLPYADVEALGHLQQALITKLCAHLDRAEELDLTVVRELLAAEYFPELSQRSHGTNAMLIDDSLAHKVNESIRP